MPDASPPTLQTAPARRNNARGAARREALLEAAVRLFAERGFRGTGIIGLAKEVGMTHVGLLHHFGTKEQLLRDVVATRDAQLADLERDVCEHRGLDALATIRRIGPLLEAEPLLSRLFCVLISENMQPGDPLHEYFRDRYHWLRTALATAMRDGQSDGTVRPDLDADLVAAETVAFILGVQTEHHLDPDRVDIGRTIDAYTTRLLASVSV